MEAGCLLQVAGFVVWEENGGKFSFHCLQTIDNQPTTQKNHFAVKKFAPSRKHI